MWVGIATAGPSPQDSSGVVHEVGEVGTNAAARADCGPGSRPESGLQGDVPAADRGSGLLSVYDISDCAHPRLLNPGAGTDLRIPLPITAHEGGFSPDGLTYWSTGVEGVLSAVDLTDPTDPTVIWQGWMGMSGHGFGISPDGNLLYLSNNFGGLSILDTGAVQRRDADAQVRQVASMSWTDGWATQRSIPVTHDGHPWWPATCPRTGASRRRNGAATTYGSAVGTTDS